MSKVSQRGRTGGDGRLDALRQAAGELDVVRGELVGIAGAFVAAAAAHDVGVDRGDVFGEDRVGVVFIVIFDGSDGLGRLGAARGVELQ